MSSRPPPSGIIRAKGAARARDPTAAGEASSDSEPKVSFGRDPSTRRGGPPPTGVLRHRKKAWSAKDPSADYSVRTVKSTVKFHALDEELEDGNFEKVQEREIEFGEDTLRELPATSRISHAITVSSTLPIAQDNDRFFGSGGRYRRALDKALENITPDKGRREPADYVGFLGWLWRWVIRVYIALTIDPINRLRYTRGIQTTLPFQASYESFILGGLIGSFDLDTRRRDGRSRRLVFKNRNASRIMMQNFPRWDRAWHLSTQVRWNRFFDLLSLVPVLPVFPQFSFPGTENNNGSRDFAIGAILRPFFAGSFFTRAVTGGQEGLVVLDKNTPAQNLAAEATGLEIANRSQYGTWFGRMKTNEFRLEHRLPTDESIVRTFVASPGSTMINNGFEHAMRCVAGHWKNMLYRENGNFGHQRQEQLDPFEFMRFHMPIVLLTLSNLRGRSTWDSRILGPFMRKLQSFNPAKFGRSGRSDEEYGRRGDYDEISAPCDAAIKLLQELRETIIPNVCAGVASRVEPFTEWVDAMIESCDRLRTEAEDVKNLVATVDVGIRVGYRLLKNTDWSVPSNSTLRKYVMSFLRGKFEDKSDCSRDAILAAVDKLAPKDYRLMRELVSKKIKGTDATDLLVGRTVSLVKREIQREALNRKIRESSRGKRKDATTLQINEWYWVKTDSGFRIHLFKSMTASASRLRFVDVDVNIPVIFQAGAVEVYEYLPVAEAISRAQKVFMTIELDYQTKFSYNAFMEFGKPDSESSLRTRLRRLLSLVQLQCSEMDKARHNVLSEIKKHRGRDCAPQSTVVLGGGPTGLLMAIHCAQSVIMSGGVLKVFESRDAYDKGAATFERAQIVRLDSRWIAMLRYHLGTSYEDVYVPLTGETDPHLGNTIPGQGFVEVSIKRLEFMLLDEVVALHSRDLIKFYTGSKVEYDLKSGNYYKVGKDVKEEDLLLLEGDERTWRVKGFDHPASIQNASELVQGQPYDLLIEGKIQKFALEEVDHGNDWYVFTAQQDGVSDRRGNFGELPSIFHGGRGRVDPENVVLRGTGSRQAEQKRLRFDNYMDKKIRMDFSGSHVIISAGKPQKSDVHFKMSSTEPYGVCCIEGLQVSKGMHRFGQPRWGTGILDDIRSASDQNTRVVGDFTKTVKIEPILKVMCEKIATDAWRVYIGNIPESNGCKPLPDLYKDLAKAVPNLRSNFPFVRDRLQTRYFELGDNYYLGMEFPREYDTWKTALLPKVAPDLPKTSPAAFHKKRKGTQRDVTLAIDTLWFESTLEVMRKGDVFNPGGRVQIPSLVLINSPHDMKLGQLNNFNCFGLDGRSFRVRAIESGMVKCTSQHGDKVDVTVPEQTWVRQHRTKRVVALRRLETGEMFDIVDAFDILKKGSSSCLVRNSQGYVTRMKNSTTVRRRSDLSRSPDGYSTSKVAIATFPVAHSVCHRTLSVRDSGQEGNGESYITAFVGDAQSSPHFMRYSGLTGAGINAMAFNNLVAQAVANAEFDERAQRYSLVTNWSNGEVVERGLGANYGEDGFLRPQCYYNGLVDYLYERAGEFTETGAPLETIVSREWMTKFASALVPRGLETNAPYRDSLLVQLELAVREKFESSVAKVLTGGSRLPSAVSDAIQLQTQSAFSLPSNVSGLSLNETQAAVVGDVGTKAVAVVDALRTIIDHSVLLRTNNARVSSQLFTQPKPTDSLFDDFAVEAQNFANGLTQGIAFATGALSLALASTGGSQFLSIFLGILGISSNFGALTNFSRYKNRNEEFRILFHKERMNGVKKGVFSLIGTEDRGQFGDEGDPFVVELDDLVADFRRAAEYYNFDMSKVDEFEHAYKRYRPKRSEHRSTIKFMKKIVGKFLPVVFYSNCYLQDDLVKIYKVLHNMLLLAKRARKNTVPGASELYALIQGFEPKLERSLETGDIRHGFLKHRPLFQQSLFVTFRFLFSPIIPAACGNLLASTRRILRKAESVRSGKREVLIREIRDLKELHFATKESQIASMMFLSATINFFVNICFTIFRILGVIFGETTDWVEIIFTAFAFGSFFGLLGALLAFLHFIRKIGHLFRLSAGMRGVARQNRGARLVRHVAFTQIILTAMRLAAVTAACVALPWVALAGPLVFDSSFELPRYVALGAVGMVVVSVLFFFIVEFCIRYNLRADLGPLVCQPFAKRIKRIHEALHTPPNGVDTQQMLDMDDWGYTAREFLHQYRFDTVFAADRFGSIQQYLQSGMKSGTADAKVADDTSVSV